MVIRRHIKSVIKGAFQLMGLEISKVSLPADHHTEILHNSALDALYSRGGAFLCPIDRIIYNNGFGYGEYKWHPFQETLSRYEAGREGEYEGSFLQQYYEKWQPVNALDALAGFDEIKGTENLAELPNYAFYHAPWTVHPPSGTLERIEWFSNHDNEVHGHPAIKITTHGFKMHGPVHRQKGELEYQRLLRVYQSIRASGYDRAKGEIGVVIIKRGSEFRFLNRRGMHRAAATAALGHTTIPARLNLPFVIDVDDAVHWPQVRAGVWGLEAAVRYISFLFDHNTQQWAQERSIIS